MCGPVLPIISAVTAIVGTGVAVYGQIKAGNARKKQEEQAAEVAKKNAVIAKQNAKEAKVQGERDVRRKRLETLQIISKQRVGMGANGLELDSGSPMDVVLGSEMMGKLDEETIRRNAEAKAKAYLQQADNFSSQSDAHILSGNNASSAGYLGGIATGIQGAGSAITNYYAATNVPAAPPVAGVS